MTIQKAIELAAKWAEGGVCTLREWEAREYHKLCLDALRAQQERENQKPLTLKELREMDGDPVWVVYDEDAGMWALVDVLEESIFLTNQLGGRSEYAADVEFEEDGIAVYRRKPEPPSQN